MKALKKQGSCYQRSCSVRIFFDESSKLEETFENKTKYFSG